MKMMRKLAILESLDAMDQIQMEKVMLYIRELLRNDRPMESPRQRQKAMEEIRLALKSDGSMAA